MCSIAGCSRKQEEPVSAPPPAPAAAATESAAQSVSAQAPPAESSLSIKRGIVTMAQDGASFQPCNERAQLWVVDQTDGVLKDNFADLHTSPTKLYVEAYGERASGDEEVPAGRSYAGTFVLEEVLYAAQDESASACNAPVPAYVVTARGNEPSWSVEVTESQMLWRQADAPKELTFPAPQTADSEGTVRYQASGNGHQLELTIDAQSCRDPLSGEFFAYAAQAVLDEKPFIGCARLGR
jgi:uncharacterized membrane protein